MSLQVDGVWKGGVWASTVWTLNVWYDPVTGAGGLLNRGGFIVNTGRLMTR